MRKDAPYLKHDAYASYDTKLMTLLQHEKLRGYGLYWMLLEMLRLKPDFKIAMSDIGMLAYRCRTRPAFMRRVICDYDLFVVENGYFYSKGLISRLQRFIQYMNDDDAKNPPQLLDK